MKKDSTIIIIFLSVIILILCYLLLNRNNNEKDNGYSYDQINYLIDQKIDENNQNNLPVVPEEKKPEVNQKTAVIKSLISKNPQYKFMVRECSYQGQTYFALDSTIMADGGTEIFDMNSVRVAFGGGFVPSGTVFSTEYNNISPTCSSVVYSPNKVDIYNVD